MIEELHVAGIVVHAYSESVQRVAAAIAGLPGAEVHATSPDGKVVATLEAPSAREISTRMEDIQHLDSVLTASLVYQHNETLEAMMEEVTHEGHPTGLR